MEKCELYNYGTTAHINFDDALNGKKVIPPSKSDWKDLNVPKGFTWPWLHNNVKHQSNFVVHFLFSIVFFFSISTSFSQNRSSTLKNKNNTLYVEEENRLVGIIMMGFCFGCWGNSYKGVINPDLAMSKMYILFIVLLMQVLQIPTINPCTAH